MSEPDFCLDWFSETCGELTTVPSLIEHIPVSCQLQIGRALPTLRNKFSGFSENCSWVCCPLELSMWDAPSPKKAMKAWSVWLSSSTGICQHTLQKSIKAKHVATLNSLSSVLMSSMGQKIRTVAAWFSWLMMFIWNDAGGFQGQYVWCAHLLQAPKACIKPKR